MPDRVISLPFVPENCIAEVRSRDHVRVSMGGIRVVVVYTLVVLGISTWEVLVVGNGIDEVMAMISVDEDLVRVNRRRHASERF